MNTCKTCKWWTGEIHEVSEFRDCECPIRRTSEGGVVIPSSGFGVFDTEPYSGGGSFGTGPDFGCIHHEGK